MAKETGIHFVRHVSSPLPFDAIKVMDDVRMIERWDKRSDGGKRLTRELITPEGKIYDIQEYPKNRSTCHSEFFVKSAQDVKVWADFIRRTTDEILKNSKVAANVALELDKSTSEVNGQIPTAMHVFCPLVELTSCYYMDQATALYLLHDEEDLFEELMERHWKMTEIWLQLAVKHKVDVITYAINGYEWLSPTIYERWAIPQARKINEFTEANGLLPWLHTCGKLKKIAESGAYTKMKLKILESLATLPTGDIDNLAKTRADIGYDIVTRGGMNVEYFYSKDKDVLLKRAEYVLESCRGFKHMLGDTDQADPPYSWKNIKAVIDFVRSTGRLYE